MYDAFSEDYDRFVNWPGRLAMEMPFIEASLQGLAPQKGVLRVLDAACGTGMHAIALAQKGYSASGADLSAPMIERARQNAAGAGVAVPFKVAGFGALASAFGQEALDALLCLGNSLPHVLTLQDLAAALANFAACLRPDGLLLIQNRNFDAVLASSERWMEPQSHRVQDAERSFDAERIFLRFYDFDPDGLLTFHVLTLRREDGGPWSQKVMSSRLRPLTQAELLAALKSAGFDRLESFGNLAGAPFEPATSSNLVVRARKQARADA